MRIFWIASYLGDITDEDMDANYIVGNKIHRLPKEDLKKLMAEAARFGRLDLIKGFRNVLDFLWDWQTSACAVLNNIISGNCSGADRLAEDWAQSRFRPSDDKNAINHRMIAPFYSK